MTTHTATVEIAGREYLLNLTPHESNTGTLYEISGKRRANGALIISKMKGYEGRALVVGISALERVQWWEINDAVAHLIDAAATALGTKRTNRQQQELLDAIIAGESLTAWGE
jgi:hypothetical protein